MNIFENYLSKINKIILDKQKILKLKKTKYLYCNLKNFQKLKQKLNKNFDIVVNFSGNIDHQNKEQTFRKV